MDFELSAEQKALVAEALRFAREELSGDVIARDLAQAFPRHLWEKAGTQRIQGLAIPTASGGRGLDPLSNALVFEALGNGCTDGGLLFSIGAHLTTAAVPIWKFGTRDQQNRYLERLCDGSLIGVGALTEAEAGSDAFGITTSARPERDGFVLNGSKRYISNASIADLTIVYAATAAAKGYHGGITAFIVEKGSPGMTVGESLPKMGLRTSPLGILNFDNVFVPAAAVLGAFGSGAAIFSAAMDWERVLLMACHVGTMQRLLDRSIAYSRGRKQFGQTISKFQAVSHRLVDMKVRLEASRLLVYRAAANLDRVRTVSLDAAVAKLFASESYIDVALGCIRTHGASGYLSESELERPFRDAVGSAIYSGTSDIQRNIIARWLGL